MTTVHLAFAGLLAAAATSTPIINWTGLVKVLLLAIATGVIIVGGFSLGLAALDVYVSSLHRQPTPDEHGLLAVNPPAKGSAVAAAPAATGGARYASLAVALGFFGVCMVGVVIGLIEMFSK
ncbi:MAG TPA: hypothetical protein VH134_10045 [Candidatus Dormibacteraeota bacterium]|nr:hypothetical protein [Candidatus Dormibacteraeota bacterium]